MITVGTDGACAGNPGPTGWCWYVDEQRWQSGALGHETNNVGELEAILRALVALPRARPVLVLTDSDYALKCVTVWHRAWRKNNWVTRGGGPVKNRDRIELIVDLVALRTGETRFEWVRGHSGHPLNAAADVRAVQARELSPRSRREWGPGWVPGV